LSTGKHIWGLRGYEWDRNGRISFFFPAQIQIPAW